MRTLELAHRYMDIFYGGKDPLELGQILAADLTFQGPLGTFPSASAYIESLRSDPPRGASFRIIEEFENGSSACLVYEFGKPGVRTPMAQLFKAREGRIHEMILIFDATAFQQGGPARA